jgi:hypothetical protein
MACRVGQRAMSASEEFRKNAAMCDELAKTCTSLDEREKWLRMKQAWLNKAQNATKPDPTPKPG